MKKLIPCLIVFLAFTSFAQAHPGALDKKNGHTNKATGEYHKHRDYDERLRHTSCGKVIKIVDGHTLDVMVGGIIQRVRLRNFNSPKLGTLKGDAIKAKLAALAAGKEACLKHNNIRNQHNHLLSKVYVNGENLVKKIKALRMSMFLP